MASNAVKNKTSADFSGYSSAGGTDSGYESNGVSILDDQ